MALSLVTRLFSATVRALDSFSDSSTFLEILGANLVAGLIFREFSIIFNYNCSTGTTKSPMYQFLFVGR